MAFPVNRPKDQDVLCFDGIDDHVLTHSETSETGAQVIITRAPGERECRWKEETARNRFNESAGDPSPRRAKCHQDRLQLLRLLGAPSVGVRQLGYQPGSAALFHFSSQLPHGILRDCTTSATGQGSARAIKRSQKFYSPAFAIFPQRQSFFYSFFFTVQSSACNRNASESLLIRCKLHFDWFRACSSG
jgi:hypothetical protein